MKMAAKKPTVTETTEEIKFGKTQLLNSSHFANRQDIVNTLLDENKEYTVSEVDQMISDFYGRTF